MRCSTLHGAAAQQSRAEAPLPPIAYVPPAVAPRAGGNAHLATHHQNLPKSGFKLNASVAAPGSIGTWPAGRLAYARCRTGARASAGKTLASSRIGLEGLDRRCAVV